MWLLHQSHNYWLLPPPPPQVVAGEQGLPGNRGLQCAALPGSPPQVLSSPLGLGRQPLDSQGHLEEPLCSAPESVLAQEWPCCPQGALAAPAEEVLGLALGLGQGGLPGLS